MEHAAAASPSWRELGYLEEREFADLRKIQPSALRNERTRGEGPPFATIGRRVVYPLRSTQDWIASKIVTPAPPQSTLVDKRPRRRPTRKAC